jgi:hypothetical protein
MGRQSEIRIYNFSLRRFILPKGTVATVRLVRFAKVMVLIADVSTFCMFIVAWQITIFLRGGAGALLLSLVSTSKYIKVSYSTAGIDKMWRATSPSTHQHLLSSSCFGWRPHRIYSWFSRRKSS